ncbi:hypothetical protein PV518_47040 [Streptomyces sp. ND04-05B]|uniref:hypothetical protein n=1 Tax=Streptomyces sp. ND04-05B TaxID=3028693 RepID=UPI0029B0DEA6|nr:hypothetical protein [Streptomyces sp. ND04-05B]MDX3069595.1 hypothetical protein [Streptomyces sp. ND04-05B]
MNEQDIETPQRYGGEPLYGSFPDDYSHSDRTFTVTIAGPERHDGEKPTKYVLEARSTQTAWARALAWHMEAEETVDCFVLADESHKGAPAGDVGFHWNDLRPEHARQQTLDSLAEKAGDLVRDYEAAVDGHVDAEGKPLTGRTGYVEGIVREYEGDAWPMVQELADLEGGD